MILSRASNLLVGRLSRSAFKGRYFPLTIVVSKRKMLATEVVNYKSVSKSSVKCGEAQVLNCSPETGAKIGAPPPFLGECESIYYLCQGVTRPGGGGGHWKEQGGRE